MLNLHIFLRTIDLVISTLILSKSYVLCDLMLYSLCMKFQAEFINFQDQLENRVLCKTFPSRQNSEVQPSVTKHEELKMHFNDIITSILH